MVLNRAYVAKRLLHAVLVIWLTFTVTFLTLYALPGDAALRQTMGQDIGVSVAISEERMAAFREELGLNDPLPVQYVKQLTGAVTGDFGRSIRNGQEVSALFARALPETLKLTVGAFVLSLLFAAILALTVVSVRSPAWKNMVMSVSAIGVAVPTFLIGMVALRLFSFQWPIFPAVGNEGIRSLVLPSIVLAVAASVTLAQIFITSLEATYETSFIETVRAKGAGEWYILLRHALRSSILPVVTVLGITAGGLIGGSVVVESVFSRAGIGTMLVEAVDFQDTPVVLAGVMFAALVYTLVNLVVDLVYPLIDHRVDLDTGVTAS